MPSIQNPKSTIQNVKAALAACGLAAKKSFGQNFMVDRNFAAAVARAAEPDARALVIEVGPGTGCLTAALLGTHPAARVLAIEIDRGLAALLRESFAREIAEQRLTLLEGDALAGKHGLAPDLVAAALELSGREYRPRRVLCSNLPYNIATPLLATVATDAEGLGVELAVATVQLELAERLLARPRESAYGAVSALMALRATGKILRRVGNEVFWPRPDVASAVIRLEFKAWGDPNRDRQEVDADRLLARAARTPPPLRREEAEPCARFLQKLFSQRRKMLRAVLKNAAALEALGLPPTARAEELAPAALLELYRFTAETLRRGEG